MSLPDFLVIGAQRAGTTWLDALLRAHPRVQLPQRRKELHFFDRHFARGSDWYESCFPKSVEPGTQLGEVTPRYLLDPEVPARIAALLPSVRLIALLRHPVDRAYSQYGLTQRDEGYRGNFTEFLRERPDAIERGFYHRQLSRYRALFPAESLLVLLLEQVRRDRPEALAAVAHFLDIDAAGFPAKSPSKADNSSGRVPLARSFAGAKAIGDRLRNWNIDAPVNLAKALGIKRIFGRPRALPAIDPGQRAELSKIFEQDAKLLGREFQLDLACWGMMESS